jgi:hypothetical protein
MSRLDGGSATRGDQVRKVAPTTVSTFGCALAQHDTAKAALTMSLGFDNLPSER